MLPVPSITLLQHQEVLLQIHCGREQCVEQRSSLIVDVIVIASEQDGKTENVSHLPGTGPSMTLTFS
jgi:hypothetical protein